MHSFSLGAYWKFCLTILEMVMGFDFFFFVGGEVMSSLLHELIEFEYSLRFALGL